MSTDTGFKSGGTDLANIFPRVICLYQHVTGSRTEETKTFTFDTDVGTTDYAVFPSFYYGYSGSSGTYSAMNTSSAIRYQPIVDERTTTGFKIKFKRTDGDNMNIYLTALVVFNSGFDYPASY